MSRFVGPRLKIVRRLGVLPGLTNKNSKREDPPGQHGPKQGKMAKRKQKQYSTRLLEKQKLRFHYGVNERQLLKYVRKARKKTGASGNVLLALLEMRLDTIIFRLGLAPTIVAARQIVNHGHILVNQKVVDIPSYICKINDIIEIKNSLKSQRLVKANQVEIQLNDDFKVPEHLNFDSKNLTGKIEKIIDRSNISLEIQERLILEYYSRKV